MDHFNYKDGELHAEQVPLSAVAARFGTPCYVYSRTTIAQHWESFDTALGGRDHLICYAVKANSNLAVLDLLARQGSGFDIVSGGELERVLAAGGDPAKVVFSGVGKTRIEIAHALDKSIACFNVESLPELQRIADIAAALEVRAPVSLRVNPDIDAGTHPYISTGLKENKFGIDINEAAEIYRLAAQLPSLKILGVDCHIGSQLTSLAPFTDALQRVLQLVDTLAEDDIELQHLDLGGGLGIRYADEEPPTPQQYADALSDLLGKRKLKVIIEPGRAMVGNAGVLLTRVEYLKHGGHKNFAVADAAMNDLLRPALYDAWQDIVPVRPHRGVEARLYDVVGPICETGDFLGKSRELALRPGDLLAVRSAGAYGFTMSSNYNTRPRAAEVMVDGDQCYEVRRRETIAELFATESRLPDTV